MATNVFTTAAARPDDKGRFEPPADPLGTVLRRLLLPLASLKLTVGLMVAAIFLIFFGTLSMAELNEFEATNQIFRTWFAWIKFQYLFPETFFPSHPQVSGGFWFPGGWIIGGLMVLNLLAAHSLRFKIQARGTRLVSGLIVIALGIGLAYLVIVAGPDKNGFEATSTLHWADAHWWIKGGLALLVGLCLYPFATLDRSRKFERGLLLAGAILLGGLLAFLAYAGDRPIINPSGMRILWQLAKGALAGVVLLVGCWLLFRKRAGIVLLHAGLLLMMSNELVVYSLHAENKLMLYEGEELNYVFDMHSPRFVVIDSSDPKQDDVVSVPIQQIPLGSVFQHELLPFDVRLDKFMKNSAIPSRAARASDALTLTTQTGEKFTAEEAPSSARSGSDAEDMPSAVVTLLKKGTTTPLGTFLVSYFSDPRLVPFEIVPQTVKVDDKPYQIALQPRREYKPYSVKLLDARKVDYLGTDKPRSYESDIRIKDASKGLETDQLIYMNNPVRYAGETFYQSNYGEDPVTHREFSMFQVVANAGWMIPYVGCMIVAVGLIAQFSQVLVRFLRRKEQASTADLMSAERSAVVGRDNRRLSKTERKIERIKLESQQAPPRGAARYLPWMIVGFAASLLWIAAIHPKATDDEFGIYEAGTLPVVYEGRPKPLDTLARTTLQVFSNRDVAVMKIPPQPGDTKAKTKTVPAVQWLLDVIADPERAEQEYETFRIDQTQLLAELHLKDREGFRYGVAEFRDRIGTLDEIVEQGRKVEASELTPLQKAGADLAANLQLYIAIREAFREPDTKITDPLKRALEIEDLAQATQRKRVPLAVPTQAEPPWESLVQGATQIWLHDLAHERGEKTPEGLARRLTAEVREQGTDKLIEQNLRQLVESVLRREQPDADPAEVQQRAAAMLKQMPDELRTQLTEKTKRELESSLTSMEANLTTSIQMVLGHQPLDSQPSEPAADWGKLLAAYRQGQVKQFNEQVADYRSWLSTVKPGGLDPTKIDFEAWFNNAAPFDFASWFYFAAFAMVALGWLFWTGPWHRAAFWLLVLTLAVHTAAIMGRIYLSGRPPVTNLYSSALFIGFGGVLLGLVMEWIYRMGVGSTIAAVAGFATLTIAHYLSAMEGDTLKVMEAVLDTNFWLATHVSCVVLGYMTTFVSGILGIIYILGGVFTGGMSPKLRGEVYRMIYGTTCFAIIFSFVGTVLGGLWADDSWGRFWGWDPKENGALIIVLWNAVILHARWDGMVKDRGLAVLAVIGNMVTAWSYFGVNQLKIGKHSYGFTQGIVTALLIFFVTQWAIVALGLLPKSWWRSFRTEVGQGSP